MKKIGIITIVDQDNYGNRLQNYATIKVYNKLGFAAETIVLNQRKNSAKYLPRAMKMLVKRIKDDCLFWSMDSYSRRRRKLFLRFSKEYAPVKYAYLWGKKLTDRYSFFSVGSDQIWNCNLDYGYFTEFLGFISKEKRLCLAPSLGVDEICSGKLSNYVNGLQGFINVSVREHSAAALVKQISGVEATVLLDPTLMLEGEEWSAIEKKPRYLNTEEPYILEYFLGGKTEKDAHDIRKIAENRKLNRIDLLSSNTSEEYCTGPQEFLYLIHHADTIMTDSFHACVFSILNKKEFYVFERIGHKSMGSRINSLFLTLGIAEKGFGLDSYWNNNQINYDECKKRLIEERERVYTFLKCSLRGDVYAGK